MLRKCQLFYYMFFSCEGQSASIISTAVNALRNSLALGPEIPQLLSSSLSPPHFLIALCLYSTSTAQKKIL